MDRAALDVALARGLPCAGWCPAGRRAEDGAIPARYPLRETPSPDPAQRTEWNVRDSDATLILAPSPLAGGTLLTRRFAEAFGRPLLVRDPFTDAAAPAADWLRHTRAARLNVAGPRESELPGIYAAARTYLLALFADVVPPG